jgi:hypothetical protein
MLFSKPVTVTHTSTTGVDAAGRPTRVVTSRQVSCAFKHRLAHDESNGGLIVTDEITFYMPPDTVIAPSDSILLDGNAYEVISDPFPVWNHRRGYVHHLQVRGGRANR